MCGIAAIVADDAELRSVALGEMLTQLRHRGRTGTLYERCDLVELGCALGTDRLPIVSPGTNRQPRRSPSGRYTVVFNGEVFNHRELLARLTEERAAPEGDSPGDTAVLAIALDHWGVDATVDRLTWEGAFVCVDHEKKTLHAARDHLGIKPLYYAHAPGATRFASEIKALTGTEEDSRIEPVPPGSLLSMNLADRSRPIVRPWWSPSPRPYTGADDEVPGRVGELLRESVRLRVPEQPYAVALSGGLDSSLVLRLAVEVNPEVTAYVLHRPGSPDLPFARRLCTDLGVPLVEVEAPGPDRLRPLMPDIVRTVETWEWQVVNHAAPMTALFERISDDGFRVVLTGEGADELFHGYTDPEGDWNETVLTEERRRRLDSLHRTNCRRLDRMGMRYGLECRVPFLDRELTEFALSLPARLSLGRQGNKLPIRRVAATLLPPDMATRRKLSFARGAGYKYAPGDVASVFGPTQLFEKPAQPTPEWSGLARYPVEEIFLSSFLDQGFGRAAYLRTAST
ncbi:asparagine synthetase B family protein [Streptomyces koyangensis]